MNKDYLRPLTPSSFRPPGDEVIPRPKPYEAMVFRDYFVAGLDFPLENFVSDVLRRFEIQLHQLTPNAFARLSVFAMAMKMLGHAPNADMFLRFYETQRKRSEVWDPIIGKKLPLEFGAFNFVPKKTRGTITIVPMYRNKWPQWTKYWFYHRVYLDCDVQEAEANEWERASPLVSTLAKWEGNRLPTFSKSIEEEARSGDAFALTSRFQISRDVIEEWVALERGRCRPTPTFEMWCSAVIIAAQRLT